MAEFGLAAGIVGVVTTGAQLSINLYKFSSAVGAAKHEVQSLAAEISMFCSVLRQLDSTLKKAKKARYSLTALDAIDNMLHECKQVFGKIQRAIDTLKRESASSEEPIINLAARVRWTLKRSKLLVSRRTLESMKATLHLMLTTLIIAEKSSSASDLPPEEASLNDRGDRLVAESLLITQQFTVDELHDAEEENEGEDVERTDRQDDLLPRDIQDWESSLDELVTSDEVSRWNAWRSSKLPNGEVDMNSSHGGRLTPVFEDAETALPIQTRRRSAITSAWLSDAVFNDGLTADARRESLFDEDGLSYTRSSIGQVFSNWITTADQSGVMSPQEDHDDTELLTPNARHVIQNHQIPSPGDDGSPRAHIAASEGDASPSSRSPRPQRQSQKAHAKVNPDYKRERIRSVFGMPLSEAVKLYPPSGIDVCLPTVVYRCLQYLRAKDVGKIEGIFRLKGSKLRIRALRHSFDTEGDIDLLADGRYDDAYAVASFLESYIRELPSPVIAQELLFTVLELDGKEAKIAAFNTLVRKLPLPNWTLLRTLCEFLKDAVNNPSVKITSMHDIITVFSYTLNFRGLVLTIFLTNFDVIFGSEPSESSGHFSSSETGDASGKSDITYRDRQGFLGEFSGSGGDESGHQNQNVSKTSSSVDIIFRVSMGDTCYTVLPAALKKYNIDADWRQYALYIVYDDQERCLGLEEKPLILFKTLENEGRKPMFKLRRHVRPIEGHSSPTRVSSMQNGAFTYSSINSGSAKKHQSSIWPGQSPQLPGGVL